jgi:hypothetical protein
LRAGDEVYISWGRRLLHTPGLLYCDSQALILRLLADYPEGDPGRLRGVVQGMGGLRELFGRFFQHYAVWQYGGRTMMSPFVLMSSMVCLTNAVVARVHLIPFLSFIRMMPVCLLLCDQVIRVLLFPMSHGTVHVLRTPLTNAMSTGNQLLHSL